MGTRDQAQSATLTNPIAGVALGEPFVLRHRGRFYLYGTNDGPPLADGRMIPVFRSDNLLDWEPLGGALEPIEPEAEHRAPDVLAWNGRFYMVVSFGDMDRRGHALWVAVADQPEGPFRLANRVSDPSEKFSTDGSWLLDEEGRLYLFRCLDFVDEADPPHGTGIVAQEMSDPLTPIDRPVTVVRAHAHWHLSQADRTMPLHDGRTFAAWTTLEGPVPVRRAGRYFCVYSGGNSAGAYGTGTVVADTPLGPYQRPRGAFGPIFGTVPGLVEGPGHVSVVQPDLVHDRVVLHGRRPGESVRRVWLCPASWRDDGMALGSLTDEPQPAPPLPTELTRFSDVKGPIPDGWELEVLGQPQPGWSLKPGDGLVLQGPPPEFKLPHWRSHQELLWQFDLAHSGSRVSRSARGLKRNWVAEAYLRFLEETPQGAAGLRIRSAIHSHSISILLKVADGRCRVFICRFGQERSEFPVRATEPFRATAFHRLELRFGSNTGAAFLDGVRICDGLTQPNAPAQLQLYAGCPAVFDAVSITRMGRTT
ncbi:MAG TPA: family 43 glycosylhydrolase [Isosphaeraceae bacterium]|jgi:hypothetical protein|nr:family 43 glycosylhydrolase [Isosphaeraceae bacterium]